MNIITVKHKFSKGQKLADYVPKIAEAVKNKPDVIVGPDYGLVSYSKDRVNRKDIINADQILSELSAKTPSTLIVPGTYALFDQGYHAAPIFRGGKLINRFFKETNVENVAFANENGFRYKRGDSDKNKIMHNGKKITVEICSDHGKQRVDRDTFLELILTRDLNAGFYLNAFNDNFSRYAIVNDSEIPKIEGFKYDKSSDSPLVLLEEKTLNEDLTQFNIK